MSGRILGRYKRLSESRQVEDSGTLRWLVWGTIEMTLLILWRQQALSSSVIFLSIAGSQSARTSAICAAIKTTG